MYRTHLHIVTFNTVFAKYFVFGISLFIAFYNITITSSDQLKQYEDLICTRFCVYCNYKFNDSRHLIKVNPTTDESA